MREYPDIDVQEYIFDFENANGTSEEELDKISNHIEEFSKVQGIEKFFYYTMHLVIIGGIVLDITKYSQFEL